MSSGIYEIRNMVNGHRYIGSAINLNGRKSTHFMMLRKGKHHSKHLQSAFNLYGEENFIFTALYECLPEELERCEQEEIDLLRPEYNKRLDAKTNRGIKMSEEFCRKMSEIKTGNKASEETKIKMSQARMGHTTSEETRRKIGLANSIALKGKPGRPISPEHRIKLNIARKEKHGYGHPQTEETKVKISASKKGKTHKGAPCSENAKEALRLRNIGNTYGKGNVLTQEHIQKMQDGRKKKRLEREQNAYNCL